MKIIALAVAALAMSGCASVQQAVHGYGAAAIVAIRNAEDDNERIGRRALQIEFIGHTTRHGNQYRRFGFESFSDLIAIQPSTLQINDSVLCVIRNL